MSVTRVVKTFKNGASQAVRLPLEFRFKRSEIYATRMDNGDITLSVHPGKKAWLDFFDLTHSLKLPEEFMATRPMNVPPKERSLFHGED